MIDGIKFEFRDFLYKKFSPEYKCSKCTMLYSEKTSYEYDEWEDYCMFGKDCYEDEYCFTPIFILNLLKNKYKKKFEYSREHQYDGLVEYMEENNLFDIYEGIKWPRFIRERH